jgi:hypothetical protein
MSKATVITDAAGKIVVVAHGHVSPESAMRAASGKAAGGVRAGPGQQLHEIEVSHDLSTIRDWDDLVKRVHPHVKSAS